MNYGCALKAATTLFPALRSYVFSVDRQIISKVLQEKSVMITKLSNEKPIIINFIDNTDGKAKSHEKGQILARLLLIGDVTETYGEAFTN